MRPTRIEHIGIAVNSLSDAIPFYEKVLGLKCYNIEEVADQKVKTAFFMVGQTKIECWNQPIRKDRLANSSRRGEKGYIIWHMLLKI